MRVRLTGIGGDTGTLTVPDGTPQEDLLRIAQQGLDALNARAEQRGTSRATPQAVEDPAAQATRAAPAAQVLPGARSPLPPTPGPTQAQAAGRPGAAQRADRTLGPLAALMPEPGTSMLGGLGDAARQFVRDPLGPLRNPVSPLIAADKALESVTPNAGTVALLALPPAATLAGEAMAVGSVSAAVAALEKAREMGSAEAVSMDGLIEIGKAAVTGGLTGAALGGGARFVGRALFGPAVPAREAARQDLRVVTPRAGRADRIDTPVGPLTTRYAAQIRDAARGLPQPDRAATDAAYDAVRQAHGGAPLDVTGMRGVLDTFRARFQTGGRQTPVALNAATLGDATGRASLDGVLDRLSTINTLRSQAATGIEPGLAVRDLDALSAALTAQVRHALAPAARPLFDGAIAARAQQGQLARMHQLIGTKTPKAGGIDGAALEKELTANAQKWQGELGDSYPTLLRFAAMTKTLNQLPEGRVIFRSMMEAFAGGTMGAALSTVTGISDPATLFAYGAFAGAAGPLASRLGAPGAGRAERPILALMDKLNSVRPGSQQWLGLVGRLATEAAVMGEDRSLVQNLIGQTSQAVRPALPSPAPRPTPQRATVQALPLR